ncbi:MAG: aminoglycoside phosphotransferase family protein [Thermomicrobiales bacterium]
MSESGNTPGAFDERRWREMWRPRARRAVAARPLAGGISAETVLIDYISPAGMLCQAVGRRHGPDIDFARNPRIAWDELALLESLRDAGVPARPASASPTPASFRRRCCSSNSSRERASRRQRRSLSEQRNSSRRFIAARPAIGSHFLPRRRAAIPPTADQLDTSLSEPQIRAALASVDPPATREDVLLHGDFWPGNLIWDRHGNPHAIDWEDAAIGDPLCDLANARLEWRLARNARVSERFTRRYVEITGRGIESLPWWDLWAALKLCGRLGGFGLDAVTERRWRAKHRRFVDEAIANLTSP